MQGCRETILDHLLFLEVLECRVKLFEVIEVFENRPGHRVDNLVRCIGRGDKGCTHAEGLGVLVAAAIHAARNGCMAVIGMFGNELLDFGSAHVDEHAVTGGRRFLDGAARVADRVDHGIDLVVTQRLGLLGCLEFGSQLEIIGRPAHGFHHDFHGTALPRSGVADVDALAFQILEVLDAGICTCNDGERFGVDGKDGPEFLEGSSLLELAGAVIGMELPVGLRDAHVEFARTDGVNVVDGTARALDSTVDTVLLPVLVDQSADGAAGRVVDTCDTTGPDRHELPG